MTEIKNTLLAPEDVKRQKELLEYSSYLQSVINYSQDYLMKLKGDSQMSDSVIIQSEEILDGEYVLYGEQDSVVAKPKVRQEFDQILPPETDVKREETVVIEPVDYDKPEVPLVGIKVKGQENPYENAEDVAFSERDSRERVERESEIEEIAEDGEVSENPQFSPLQFVKENPYLIFIFAAMVVGALAMAFL